MALLGQITVDELLIMSVNSDPALASTPAPVGSIALLDDDVNGTIWLKTGAANNAWSLIPKLANATLLQQNGFVLVDAGGNLITNTARARWDGVGSFSFGANAPTTPQSTVHLDRGNALGAHVRFTAGTTTGQTAGDGTEIGIDSAGNAEIRQHENSNINFYTNNLLRGSWAPNGQLIVGHNAPIDITGSGAFPVFQIIGTAATQMVGVQYSNDIIGPVFNMLKSRGATIGVQGLLSNNDEFGRLQFRGSDGVNFQAGASIRAFVNGTAAAGSMPGRLELMTTPASSTTPVTRMTIDSTGLAIFSQGIRLGNESSSVGGNVRYVSDSDAQAYVGGAWRSLINIANNLASATASTTTTSATDVVMDSMTITPGAGTYIAMFTTTLQSSSSDANIFVSIYQNGAQIAYSEIAAQPRVDAQAGLGGQSNLTINTNVYTQAIATVAEGQAIDVRWRRSAGTATALQRSLILARVNI